MKRVLKSIADGIDHVWRSLGYSFDGLKTCARDEVAFRQELLVGVVHVGLVLSLELPLATWVYLTVLYVLLLTIELINTAIESVVNYRIQEIRMEAKKAKDCASAAVFCITTLFAISWIVVLIQVLIK